MKCVHNVSMRALCLDCLAENEAAIEAAQHDDVIEEFFKRNTIDPAVWPSINDMHPTADIDFPSPKTWNSLYGELFKQDVTDIDSLGNIPYNQPHSNKQG